MAAAQRQQDQRAEQNARSWAGETVNFGIARSFARWALACSDRALFALLRLKLHIMHYCIKNNF
jgi:hypothetical protein